jgi:hypothetical protein
MQGTLHQQNVVLLFQIKHKSSIMNWKHTKKDASSLAKSWMFFKRKHKNDKMPQFMNVTTQQKKIIKPSGPSFFFIVLHYNDWWTFTFFAMHTQILLLTLTLIRLMRSLMQQKLTPFLPMHLMGLDKCEAYMSIDIARVLGEQKATESSSLLFVQLLPIG